MSEMKPPSWSDAFMGVTWSLWDFPTISRSLNFKTCCALLGFLVCPSLSMEASGGCLLLLCQESPALTFITPTSPLTPHNHGF